MHARCVTYMVDHCSTTARLGTRKWAPRFDYALMQQAYVALDSGRAAPGERVEAFRRHPIHDVLREVAKMRPPVDIAVR